MIKKFKYIKNFAVFQDFDWDNNLRDKGNNVIEFGATNIIYGRNYSGKTSLSRIVRATETGTISDKYDDPEFEIQFESNICNTKSLTTHNETIRVFNEDFVKENLSFLNNHDGDIATFAILGKGNNLIEQEIKKLQEKLGKEKDDENEASGFYLELSDKKAELQKATDNYKNKENKLKNQLTGKATNNPNGIKYQSNIYGDQNYNIKKLKADISTVLSLTYKSIDGDKKGQYRCLLAEKPKSEIPLASEISINLREIAEQSNTLLTQSISSSNKIEQLVNHAMLNKWVQDGRKLHKEKELKNCAFCNNKISNNRWQYIERHFDEESKQLEEKIDILIKENESKLTQIEEFLPIDKNIFYSKFHDQLDELIKDKENNINSITKQIKLINTKLQERKDDILKEKEEIIDTTESNEIDTLRQQYERIRTEANEYTKSLSKKQKNAQTKLRLQEVKDFINAIGYKNLTTEIKKLENEKNTENSKVTDIENKIKEKIKEIEAKKRKLNDEEEGARKVNDYLKTHFGHQFLKLEAKEQEGDFKDKKICFQITRDGEKAYHLSQGECNLIAFCYFVAKLKDTNTESTKPIIWIDDPISSLDSNHVFFIFGLIQSEIVNTKKSEQLFLSTHNLEFLKYLKRLSVKKKYFLIERKDKISTILPMPKYLENYVTEFNYLFEQIYKCAPAENPTDDTYATFYNFGNNVRKFLEIYLYYKYPDGIDNTENNNKRISNFFGDEVQQYMITRMSNEHSHLSGSFERGSSPINTNEMNRIAKKILAAIEEKDSEQYSALCASINENQ